MAGTGLRAVHTEVDEAEEAGMAVKGWMPHPAECRQMTFLNRVNSKNSRGHPWRAAKPAERGLYSTPKRPYAPVELSR